MRRIYNYKNYFNKITFRRSTMLQSFTWSDTETVIEVMHLYSAVLKHKPHTIQFNRLDLILVPFAIWSTNVTKNKTKFGDSQVHRNPFSANRNLIFVISF